MTTQEESEGEGTGKIFYFFYFFKKKKFFKDHGESNLLPHEELLLVPLFLPGGLENNIGAPAYGHFDNFAHLAG